MLHVRRRVGQQQRVALARALAPRPRVVLLDEPSSLDASLRVSAGREVTRVLRSAGATAGLVTHDQGEVLSLADRVAVMDAGRIAQVDTPAGLYADPVDVHVAAFVGGAGLLPAIVRGATATCVLGHLIVANGHQPRADGTAVRLLVRPEQIRLVAAETGRACAVVDEVRFYGPYATVRLTVEGEPQLVARVPTAGVPAVGARVGVQIVGAARAYA
jgi:iron(III) transport system ATP-binding protein